MTLAADRPLTVLVDMPVHPASMARLQAMPGLRVITVAPADDARDLALPDAHRVDALFCTTPPRNLDAFRALRWIQICSAGFEQLNGLDLPGRGITATCGLGIFDVPIAEWNIAMMVNLCRDLRGMIQRQDHGLWERSPRFQNELRGATVGFWGYGGSARETARLAKAMGLRVHVHTRGGVRPRPDVYCLPGVGDPDGALPDRVFGPDQRDAFLAELDFLILAMPETAASRGIVGEAELRALPRRACLLNPARGPLVQESALLQALRDGTIAGAALDTHFAYPLPPDHPLWQMPNVILTPHIAGSGDSPHFLSRIWDVWLQNVSRFRDGRPLLNRIRPDDLA